MLVRALMVMLPIALAAAAQDQPVSDLSSKPSATSPVQLADGLRPVLGISPAAGTPLAAPVATPTLPPDGDMEASDPSMSNLEIWFLRYGATLQRAE
jgi:hypothetical protein